MHTYIKKVKNNFEQYKECYEKNYEQKKELGLMFTVKKDRNINIVPEVCGVVVVGGYAGLAKENIKELKNKHPDIVVCQINNKIKL